MQELPDNPNLDFLRRQAKDLLAALRESTPQMSLSGAQQALADQYGFRSWEALRLEVGVRRARQPVPPDGLVEALSAAFGLGPEGVLHPVSYSPYGRIWRLTTSRGRWLAVPGYPWMGEENAEAGARLQATVAGRVQAPVPRWTREGRLVERVAGTPWRVSEWTDLGPSPVLPVREAVARRVGQVAGALHATAIPSDVPVNPYLTVRRPASDWDELVDRARASGQPWADRVADLLPVYADLGATGSAPRSDDLILCHCNLVPDTVRLGAERELVVTEWSFAGSLTAEQEVASLLTQWVARPTVNRLGAQAFVAGYRHERDAFPELTLDSFGVAVSGYLAWTYNALCEAIDPPDADAGAFAGRAARDLLARPLTTGTLEHLVNLTVRS